MKRTTRHGMRRTWLSKVAAVLAGLTIVMTPLAAVPAHAEPVAIQVSISPNPAQARVGDGSTSVTITLTNSDQRKKSDEVQAAVTMTGVEAHADYTVNQGSCDSVQGNAVSCGELEPRGQTSFTVDITARTDSDLAEGQTANGNLSVTISPPNSGTGSGQVSIVGTNQNATGIEGTVTDLDGEPVEGVEVAAKDSKDATFSATTDGSGRYTINEPVAAGTVELTFTKDGYAEKTETGSAQNGQMLTVNSRMEAEAAEEEPSEEEPAPETDTAAEDDSDSISGTMLVLIILGALLVLGGIVAIVMLIRKGKSDDDDDEDSPLPDVPSNHKPHATQTGQLGVYDSSPRPGMDAPTMIHNGPLLNDSDLARYGSEPASGFGPSYGDQAGPDDSTKMYPSSGAGTGADSTRMYPTSGGPTSGGAYSGPTSGAGYGSGQTPGGAYSGPTSGAGYGSGQTPGGAYSGPTSGAGYGSGQNPGGAASGQGWDRGGQTHQGGDRQPSWGDRQDGGWGRGYHDSNAQTSGGEQGGYGEPYRGDRPRQGQTGWSGGGQEGGWSSASQQGGWSPQSDDRSAQPGGWSSGRDATSGWDGRGRGQDWSGQPDAQGGQQNWGQERQGDWSRGEDDRRQPPRRYGDDGYDDRPQSW